LSFDRSFSICYIRNTELIWRKAMRDKIEEVLAQIRPQLEADGGNVELVDVNDGTVSVRLTGACAGCPMSTMTLKGGIERILKEYVPEVKEVVAV
jgi:Fe-S cluster biogenesis protein NfuA